MTGALVVAALLAWAGWGFAGFVYWWTTSWSLELADALLGLLVALVLGPTSWLVGKRVHRNYRRPSWPPRERRYG